MLSFIIPVCVIFIVQTVIFILMKNKKIIKPIPKDSPKYNNRKFLSKIWAVGIYSTLIVIFLIADELYEVFVLYGYFLLNVFFTYHFYTKEKFDEHQNNDNYNNSKR